jgi:DNA polymerase-3 subunit delta'
MKNPYLERALEAAAENRASHAYLFYGAETQDMQAGAKMLAQSLNCKNLDSKNLDYTGGAEYAVRPCGTCSNCRKIAEGIHPDVTWLLPNEGSMKIGQIRPLQDIAQRKPIEGVTKVIVLEDVHKITDQAANSLLKLLEDPPDATVLILITRELERMLPTLLSRCWLAPFPENTRKDMDQAIQSAARILQSLPLSFLEVFRWAASLDKDKEGLEPLLEAMETLYRNRMAAVFDEKTLPRDPMPYVRAQNSIREARWLLSRNVNPLLTLESLLLDLRKIEINEEWGENSLD